MKEKSFIIIKEIEQPNGKILPVVLTNSGEVWEFNNEEEAKMLALRLTENSDSGWKYKTRVV
jgi:hypothetical protein